jgi:hypothetical protein
MKKLISRNVQAGISRKLLLNEELIEQFLQRNLARGEPMNSCSEAMSWLDKVSDRNKGFNRDYTLQKVRSSADGSLVYGVFEIDGKWYGSSFKTSRLYFQYWGTDVGCIANVADEDIGDLLNRFNATPGTHLKAEFCSVFQGEDHNAFFSWKGSNCYGCIRHRAINSNATESIVDSDFHIKMEKEDFLEIIRPYLIIPGRSEANQNVNHYGDA